MGVEVEFVTLGDASKKLKVPSPTLRLWTDELEKNEVHFVKRNQRDERIYYESDMEIFSFMRDLKKEHGRKTQTKDIALMIYQKAVEDNMFDLRRSEDAPKPESSTLAIDILNNDDIKRLMESGRVQQFVKVIIDETTKNLREELIKEVRQELQEGTSKLQEAIEKNNTLIEESITESRADRIKREEREARLEQQKANASKGFFSKLFGIVSFQKM